MTGPGAAPGALAGVLVLAAGRGARLEGYGGGVPKPLLPLAGRTLLEWNLTWLAAAGIRRVHINLHHRGEAIVAHAGNGARFGLEIHYSPEEELLGTAGGWRRVAEAVPGRWLVLCGDNAVRFDLARFQARHAAAGCAATVALFDPALHLNTGIAGGRALLGADGRVRGFREGGGPGPGLVSAGVYLLEPAVLAAMPPGAPDFGRDVFPVLAARGELGGHVLEREGFCLGVDTPALHGVAQRLLARVELPA